MNPSAAKSVGAGRIERMPRMIEGGALLQAPQVAQGLVAPATTAASPMSPAAACDRLYQDSQILEQLVEQLQQVSQQFRVNVPMPALPTQRAEAPQQPTSAPQPPMSELAHRLQHIHDRLSIIATVMQATISSFDL